jgi:AraC family transcriptional regulator, regulatory protein of adaptative response / methylated-DNA-[protein]-cysteine methyltransferase
MARKLSERVGMNIVNNKINILSSMRAESFTIEHVLKALTIETPAGQMVMIADEKAVYLLAFAQQGYERSVARLKNNMLCAIVAGRTPPMALLEQEIQAYCAGTLKEFTTAITLIGTPFQESVWKALRSIPYGQTRSYADIAISLGKPTAFRAVAQANSANPICIIVPCHRVINTSGALGGYAGGIARKQWLLDQEKNNVR